MSVTALRPDVAAGVAEPTSPVKELPGWPVAVLMVGYPVWWGLGLGFVMPLVFGALMAAILVVHRRVLVVPGVLPWVVFCLWAIPCALMLDSVPRLAGYGLRTAQLFSVAVVLIYVVNTRNRFTVRRAVIGMTVLWAMVVVFGYLALIWPDMRFTTPTSAFIPEPYDRNSLVRDTFWPRLAEVQQPWGAPAPFNRPAAPFPYSNNWGAAIAMLTPIAVAALGLARRWPARIAISTLLLASLVPIGASSNRGMFLGLAVALGYAALRLGARGHAAPLAGLATVAGMYGLHYLYGGGADAIALRQEFSASTDTRSSLYLETLQRTLESPILGYGAPRPSETAEISAGTQGWIWMTMFSYGFVGLALFLWFLVGVVVRTWHVPDTVTLLMHSSLIAVCAMIAFYGLHVALLVVLAVVAGVLLRERASGRWSASALDRAGGAGGGRA
jgi:polysaccharide biosynthesis protein PslJ